MGGPRSVHVQRVLGRHVLVVVVNVGRTRRGLNCRGDRIDQAVEHHRIGALDLHLDRLPAEAAESECVGNAGADCHIRDATPELLAEHVRKLQRAARALIDRHQQHGHLCLIAAAGAATKSASSATSVGVDQANLRIRLQTLLQLLHHPVGDIDIGCRGHHDGDVDFALIATGEEVDADAAGRQQTQSADQARQAEADDQPAAAQPAPAAGEDTVEQRTIAARQPVEPAVPPTPETIQGSAA